MKENDVEHHSTEKKNMRIKKIEVEFFVENQITDWAKRL